MNPVRLDVKDHAILRELDVDFRQSFSNIGKKVGLSKNSVALRFDRLKEFMSHDVVAIGNQLIGYYILEVYYNLDHYDKDIEKRIIHEIRKHNNILWVARYYGYYDLCLCVYAKKFSDILSQITKFNEKISDKINQKEIQVIYKQYHFRHNFIHKEPIKIIYEVPSSDKIISISNTDKRILSVIRNSPRMNLIDVAQKSRLSPKAVSIKIKELEKKKVVMGYFMTLNYSKFNHSLYKLIIQLNRFKDDGKFEEYLKSIKNIKYIAKMLGLWDYQIDCIYENINELQEQIDLLKQNFPSLIKKVGIISLGYRIATNMDGFNLKE